MEQQEGLPISVLVTAITCGHPGNPINGLTQGNQFNLNDVVKFVCNPGYMSEGAARSQCLANGQWSDTLPTCRSESPSPPTSPAPLPSVAQLPTSRSHGFDPGVMLIQTGKTWAEKGHKGGFPRHSHVKFHHGYVKKANEVSYVKIEVKSNIFVYIS